MRFRFILGLIILAVALQFIAKTLGGVLPMMQEAAQYSAGKQVFQLPIKYPAAKTPAEKPSFVAKTIHKIKTRLENNKPIRLVSSAAPAPIPHEADDGNAFMQITLEDIRPPLKNKALGEEASARLDAFLREKRVKNVRLAEETEALFGKEAQKDVMYILVQDEKESLNNARQSKTAQDFARRQEKTDKKISAKLAAVFEKHKAKFNRRLNENSPAWNDFFKRVNDFQKAAD